MFSGASTLASTQLPSRRVVNLIGAAICAVLMGFALYSQYIMGLEPCPLCAIQRIAMTALGVVLLVAVLHGPGPAGGRAYGLLAGVCAAAGIVVASRHVWLQSLPPDEVPACGPGLGYILDTFPLGEALKQVFTGSGECAKVDWTFLGLSMPFWVLVWFVILGVVAVWNGWRSTPR
jgi:disulfide bond formation protein DsbB